MFTVYLVGETDGRVYHVLQLGWVAPLYVGKQGAYYPGSIFTEKTPEEMRCLVKAWELAV